METNRVRIMVLVCSARPGALGPTIGGWFTSAVTDAAATLGCELVPVSLGELALPMLDEEEHPSSGVYHHAHTRRWSALVAGCEGIVAITPEYNYGMPATLKNALDYLGREWAWKPIGFVSYGNTSAGTRSVQHAKQVVTTLRLVPLGRTIAIRIGEAVEAGRLRPDPQRDAAAEQLLGEVVRLAHSLRPMREAGDPDSIRGPIPGSYVRRLGPRDAPEVMVLQRCCWVDEAIANRTLAIGPFYEDLDEIRGWLSEWRTDGLWLDGRLLGMVRTRSVGTVGHIGRLAMVPDLRGLGAGGWLLRHAEAVLGPECETVVLFTGSHSERNIGHYLRAGYELASTDEAAGTVELTKTLVPLAPCRP